MRIERMQSPITGGEAAYSRRIGENAEAVSNYVTGSNPDGESGGGARHYPRRHRASLPVEEEAMTDSAESQEGAGHTKGTLRVLDITV